MDEYDPDLLTIAYQDDIRIRLREVQAVFGDIIAITLDHVPEERQSEAQRASAPALDRLIASARLALPGERVLTGEQAKAAAREVFREQLRDQPGN